MNLLHKPLLPRTSLLRVNAPPLLLAKMGFILHSPFRLVPTAKYLAGHVCSYHYFQSKPHTSPLFAIFIATTLVFPVCHHLTPTHTPDYRIFLLSPCLYSCSSAIYSLYVSLTHFLKIQSKVCFKLSNGFPARKKGKKNPILTMTYKDLFNFSIKIFSIPETVFLYFPH